MQRTVLIAALLLGGCAAVEEGWERGAGLELAQAADAGAGETAPSEPPGEAE